MKRTITAIMLIIAFCFGMSAFAAGADLEIGELTLDKSSYKVGDTATITFEYNVPYEGIEAASAKFELTGLENMQMTSARTLVCDDVSCVMHGNTDFLAFSGNKLTLGAGYSGTVTFEAKVTNSEKVSVKCKLNTNLGGTSKSCSAAVSDYVPSTPVAVDPTPKATSTPKPTTKPTSTPKSTPKPTPKQSGTANTPVTGSASFALIAVAAIAGGAGAIVLGRRKDD